jgi:GH24 family phage-related lysozyme (muramidase)
MDNRFLEMNSYLKQCLGQGKRNATLRAWQGNGNSHGAATAGSGTMSRQASRWSQPMSAAQRTLVILIENGGVDLGIPELVDKLLKLLPGTSFLPDSLRQDLIDFLRKKIQSFTDNLIETAELSINRYSAAKPEFFSDVVVLRDGTSSYQNLKNMLISLTKEGKIIDLFILTHGSDDFISVPGGVNAQKIREMKAENGGKPLSIRSVYMMNCVGSSLNQAWIDAGAKVSSGSIRNNYLPEPTMFFFWSNWKEGETFENAATSAYRKTISTMRAAVKGFLSALSLPGVGSLVDLIDVENLDFVRDSAPVIQGQRSVTINSDDLSFGQTMSSSLATTVLPVNVLKLLGMAQTDAGTPRTARTVSAQCVEFAKGWEAFRANKYTDPVGHCAIGYGTLLHRGNCDGRAEEKPYENGVSEADATHLLRQELDRLQQVINDNVTVELNQNQNDALISFVYNIGDGPFRNSTLLKVLNQSNYGAVPTELKKWVKGRQNGELVTFPGLVKRRDAEVELFQKPVAVLAQSLSGLPVRHSYAYHSPSQVVTQQSHYSLAQNPGVIIAGVTVGDAAQIGLGAVAVVQSQVSASQGSFTLSYDKAQRMLTNEARQEMPGSQSAKKSYSTQLLFMGNDAPNQAKAHIIIEWEGNAYGEIGTPVMRRDLTTSTEWSRSSANTTITKVDRIPVPNIDPRTLPIIYTYEGTYDPFGNGHFEFSGEFELNAFGGLKFNRHEVVSRSLLDFAIGGSPSDYVVKGQDILVPVPAIPQEQIDYLKKKLP